MAQKSLEILKEVMNLRQLINITDSMTTAEYLDCWQCIKDMHNQAKGDGMDLVASQIAALHRAMLNIRISDANDIEYEEA